MISSASKSSEKPGGWLRRAVPRGVRGFMKRFLKTIVNAVALLLVLLPALAELLARRVLGRDVWFYTHAQILSLLPGKVGNYLRNAYYHLTLQRCPFGCLIDFGVLFTHSEAQLGERVYIGARSTIGMAAVGDDTMLADGVQLLSGKGQHGVSDPDLPFQQQEGRLDMIHIGRNCWIGTNAIVMADVGADTIIGAGSVVTQEIPEKTVAVGSPARAIRATFAKS